jgi:hypothetical protein
LELLCSCARGCTGFTAISVPNELEKWGIDMSNPEKLFREADRDGGGMILFIEFCDWAIKKSLDLEDDDDAL